MESSEVPSHMGLYGNVGERLINQGQSLSRMMNARDDFVLQKQVSIIEQMDRRFLDWIVRWHNALTGTRIDLDEVKDLVALIQELFSEQQYSYIDSLRFPEVSLNAKIPRLIPNPTASFKFRHSVLLDTNASGNFIFLFSPYFLINTGNNYTTFIYNNAPVIDGVTAIPSTSATWQGLDIGQIIPTMYSNYALVSASLIVQVNESALNEKGILGGGVSRDRGVVGAVGSGQLFPGSITRYTKFDTVDQLKYSSINKARDGLRMLYFPPDESFLDFKDITGALAEKPAFNWIVYGSGFPPNSLKTIRVDVYLNFEGEPDPSFSSLIPVDLPPERPQDIEPAIRVVKKQPVTSLKDHQDRFPDIIDNKPKKSNIIDTLTGFLPSMGQLLSLATNKLLPKSVSDIVSSVNIPAMAMDNFMKTDTAKDMSNTFKKVSFFK